MTDLERIAVWLMICLASFVGGMHFHFEFFDKQSIGQCIENTVVDTEFK